MPEQKLFWAMTTTSSLFTTWRKPQWIDCSGNYPRCLPLPALETRRWTKKGAPALLHSNDPLCSHQVSKWMLTGDDGEKRQRKDDLQRLMQAALVRSFANHSLKHFKMAYSSSNGDTQKPNANNELKKALISASFRCQFVLSEKRIKQIRIRPAPVIQRNVFCKGFLWIASPLHKLTEQ